MKIVELNATEFDNLVKTEPNVSIYQTSNWAKFYSSFSYTPLYIGYVDDNEVYSAFGLLLVKKGKGLFAKKEAVCPYGFLINYHDSELLKTFIEDLNIYLSKNRIQKLVINPNIKFKTKNGNNEYLVNILMNLGFVRTKDNFIYETDVSCFKPYIQKDNVFLNTYVADSKSLDKLLKTNTNYENLYNALQKKAVFVVCELDSYTSINSISAIIDEATAYIIENGNNPECENEIATKKDIITKNNETLQLIEKCVNENGDNPIIGVTCLVEYANSVTQLLLDKKEGYELFNGTDALNEKIAHAVNRFGYSIFYGYTPYSESKKIDYIGEYTLNK